MSNTKDHNHEAITNGQRTASRKFRNTSKNLPVTAWTDLPLLGHMRDFSTVGKFQPVWRLQSDIQQSEQDSALTQLQQEHIEARATALGCTLSSTMREVNGVNVWYIAFVDNACQHRLEQLKPTENGLLCECGKLFPSNEPIMITAQSRGGDIPPKNWGVEKTITLTPQQAAGMLKVETNAVDEIKPICPQCENPYPHSHRGGGYSCEECGHEW